MKKKTEEEKLKKKKPLKEELSKEFKKNNGVNFKSETTLNNRLLLIDENRSDSILIKELQKKNIKDRVGEDFSL